MPKRSKICMPRRQKRNNPVLPRRPPNLDINDFTSQVGSPGAGELQSPAAPRLQVQGTSSFSCHICHKTLSAQNTLREHINGHTREIAYPCTKCGRKFFRPQYLATHLKVHAKEELRLVQLAQLPYKCTAGAGCHEAFPSKQGLAAHRPKHRLQCAFCPKAATSIRLLNYHHMTHTGEFPEKCSRCKKWFTSATVLITHKCRARVENPKSPMENEDE